MDNKYNRHNRRKYNLKVHIVLVTKYRKQLLKWTIADDVKQKILDLCNSNGWNIIAMETDKDHIHYMIETEPNINLSNWVRTMKSYTTYHIWKLHKKYLSKEFWKENTFFTDGYFICSIGNVSEKQLRKYIENQG